MRRAAHFVKDGAPGAAPIMCAFHFFGSPFLIIILILISVQLYQRGKNWRSGQKTEGRDIFWQRNQSRFWRLSDFDCQEFALSNFGNQIQARGAGRAKSGKSKGGAGGGGGDYSRQ
jgi:hypothetical protein